MQLLNLITACAREFNLPRLAYSIEKALENTQVKIHWVIVFDRSAPEELPEYVKNFLLRLPISNEAHFLRDPKSSVGVSQKNFGLEVVKDGFFAFLDDDTIMHPMFLGISGNMIMENPDKMAFVFSQMRLDPIGYLEAAPENVQPCKIDSGQVVMHRSLVGDIRIDLADVGVEDYVLIKKVYDRHADKFAFLNRTLSYYNYLRPFGERAMYD